MDTMSGMKSLLHADGSIWWMMGGEYKFTCVINTLNFPFDGHTCRLEIMSWSEGQSFIRLTYEVSISAEFTAKTVFTDSSPLVPSEAFPSAGCFFWC